MRSKLTIASFVVSAIPGLVACGSSGATGKPEPDGGVGQDAAPPEEARFERDTCPDESGPCLWIEAVPGDAEVEITVSGRSLGEVVGLSAHLVWDEEILLLPDAGAEPGTLPEALDPSGAGDAVTIASRAGPGDLALGGARVSPAVGPSPIEAETAIARLTLRRAAPGSTRLDLGRAVIARAGGALEAVAAAGGLLVLPEVTP